MSGPEPEEIWESALDEGERRMRRGPLELTSTGVVGGFDVMLGILALVFTTGALRAVLPEETAHVIGSLVFGIGFVFIVIGRSELFTENFLIPIGAVIEGRGRLSRLVRMWAITLAANLVGLTLLSFLFATDGVLEESAMKAAGSLADTFTERSVLSAFLSALVAGAVMTLFTWLNQAVERDNSRILIAMLVGFLLVAPSLNHAVVSFGEILFGMAAGTTDATVGELFANLGIAIVGNLLGGVAAVTWTRLVQARSTGDDDEPGAGVRAAAAQGPRPAAGAPNGGDDGTPARSRRTVP